jgi:hypothetical protein
MLVLTGRSGQSQVGESCESPISRDRLASSVVLEEAWGVLAAAGPRMRRSRRASRSSLLTERSFLRDGHPFAPVGRHGLRAGAPVTNGGATGSVHLTRRIWGTPRSRSPSTAMGICCRGARMKPRRGSTPYLWPAEILTDGRAGCSRGRPGAMAVDRAVRGLTHICQVMAKTRQLPAIEAPLFLFTA